MQNTPLQRSILYTILHFIAFYIITASCDYCKRSVNKSTSITVVTKPTEKQKETIETDLKETNPSYPLPIKDFLYTSDKEKNNYNDYEEEEEEEEEEENDDEELKNELPEELKNELTEELKNQLAEDEKHLEEEASYIKKIISNQNALHDDYNNSSNCMPQPSAPPSDYYPDSPLPPDYYPDPPPPYNPNWYNKLATNSLNRPTSLTSSMLPKHINQGATLEANGIASLKEKLKDIRLYLTKIKNLKLKLKYLIKNPKKRLEKEQRKRNDLIEKLNALYANKSTEKSIESTKLRIQRKDVVINLLRRIIEDKSKKQKNSTVGKSVNEKISLHPTQEWEQNDTSTENPLQYSFSDNSPLSNIYPRLPEAAH